jgi:RNA polymerase sigma factor (sigma-70 family)
VPEKRCAAADPPDVADERRDHVLAAARRREPGAWERLVEEFLPLVRATARRQGLSPVECDDVVQTVWVRLFEAVDRIRDDAALPAWLATTTRREAWAVGRRRARETPQEDLVADVPPVGPDDVFDAVHLRLRAEALTPCVAALPERERRLVEALLDPSEPSYREIGDRLGMPVGAIGPVRQRAARRLRSLMEGRPAVGVRPAFGT